MGMAADKAEALGANPKPVILVVSLGTSDDSSRHITIGAVEDAIQERFSHDFDVRKAFTSQAVIDELAERSGVEIDTVEKALDRCAADGVRTLIVQPTFVTDGSEYADLESVLRERAAMFDDLVLCNPLLTESEDYDAVADALARAFARHDDGATAFCFVDYGAEGNNGAACSRLQEAFAAKGYGRFFAGTAEAEPSCAEVMAAASAAGCTKAVLRPLAVAADTAATTVIADHENPESWASQFLAAGFETTCVIEGLGQLNAIDEIFAAHVEQAVDLLGGRPVSR